MTLRRGFKVKTPPKLRSSRNDDLGSLAPRALRCTVALEVGKNRDLLEALPLPSRGSPDSMA